MKSPSPLLLSLLLTACATTGTPTSTASGPSLYERAAAKLASRPDLAHLGEPAPQMSEAAWMIGSWVVDATVFATPTTPASQDHGESTITAEVSNTWLQMADAYAAGVEDLGFLTYNPVVKRWLSIGIDLTGNAVQSSATAWEGNRLVLLAKDVEILGEKVTLRQTLTRLSNDEFTVLNEELRADGSWLSLDQYRYRRAGSKALAGH